MNNKNVMFGEDLLLNTLINTSDNTVLQIRRSILGELKSFLKERAAQDDITLIILKNSPLM